MRLITTILVLGILLVGCQSEGTRQGNLGSSDLTPVEIEKYYRFVSFLVQDNLTEEDKQLLRSELEEGMKVAPAETRQSLNMMFALLDSVNKYTDPVAQGVWRSYILAMYYPSLQTQAKTAGKKYALQIMIDKYSPILAINTQTHRVYTEKDHKGLLEMLRFGIVDLAHRKFKLTPKIDQTIREKVASHFASMDIAGQNVFGALAIYGTSLKDQYQTMSPEEKARTQRQMFQILGIDPNAPASGGGMSAMDFEFMSNMLKIQHETNMAIINNMNPDWEYRYE